MMRRVVVATLGIAVLAVCSFALLSGPFRDTDVSRYVHGDLPRSEAIAQCVESADLELDGADVPRISEVRTKFEGRKRLEWAVTGELVAGDLRGPFECKISWTAGGATSYTEYLSLPNGEGYGIGVSD
jgi:hypothetical protein